MLAQCTWLQYQTLWQPKEWVVTNNNEYVKNLCMVYH